MEGGDRRAPPREGSAVESSSSREGLARRKGAPELKAEERNERQPRRSYKEKAMEPSNQR